MYGSRMELLSELYLCLSSRLSWLLLSRGLLCQHDMAEKARDFCFFFKFDSSGQE